MSYILTLEDKLQKERDAAIYIQKNNQLYADMLKQHKQISAFPNSQITVPTITYSNMMEDSTALKSFANKESARQLFVIYLQKWLTKVSSENLAEKLDIYQNSYEMFDAVAAYYQSFKKYIDGERLGKYTMSIILGLVLSFLKQKGITPTRPDKKQDKADKKVAEQRLELIKEAQKPELVRRVEDILIQLKDAGLLSDFTNDPQLSGVILKNGSISIAKIKSLKIDDLKAILRFFDEPTARDVAIVEEDEPEVVEGSGFKKKLRQITSGSGTPKKTEVNHGTSKYVLDVPKLRRNILAVKYRASRNFVIKATPVSDDARDLIMDIYNGEFNERLFDKMNDRDQAVVQLFIDSIRMQDEIHVKNNKLEELWYQWGVAKGEYNAGNHSKEVKDEIKTTTLKLMELKKIGNTKGLLILAQLNM